MKSGFRLPLRLSRHLSIIRDGRRGLPRRGILLRIVLAFELPGRGSSTFSRGLHLEHLGLSEAMHPNYAQTPLPSSFLESSVEESSEVPLSSLTPSPLTSLASKSNFLSSPFFNSDLVLGSSPPENHSFRIGDGF